MLRRARYLLVAVFVMVAVVGVRAQRSTAPQPDAKPSESTKDVTKGSVTNDVYKNASIGLSFTAPGLHFNLPEMRGAPGTVPLMIMAPASGDPGTGFVNFYAEALAFYPEDQRDAASYMQKIVRDHAAQGYMRVDGKASEQLGGVTFVRGDFAKGYAYETVLIAVHNGYAFQFVVGAGDFAAIDKRIASMDVKVTP